MIDNAFDSITDADRAQKLADGLSVEKLHRKLWESIPWGEELTWRFCPVY